MKQDVLVMVTRPPGRVHVSEGLRAARGVAAGFDQHDVTVLFAEDGVYSARATVDREALNLPDHVADLRAEDGRLVADGTALQQRGIDRAAVAGDITVVDGSQTSKLIRHADHTLDF